MNWKARCFCNGQFLVNLLPRADDRLRFCGNRGCLPQSFKSLSHWSFGVSEWWALKKSHISLRFNRCPTRRNWIPWVVCKRLTQDLCKCHLICSHEPQNLWEDSTCQCSQLNFECSLCRTTWRQKENNLASQVFSQSEKDKNLVFFLWSTSYYSFLRLRTTNVWLC